MDDVAHIQEAGYADPVLFMRTFLGDWFPRKMPWLHRGILAVLLRRTDFLLNFGHEVWQDEEADWTPEDLVELCDRFRWKDDKGEAQAIFTLVWKDDRIVQVNLVCSRFTQIIIPRGFSKSTLLDAVVVFKIVYQDRRFILYVSATATHAQTRLAAVRRQLESNEYLMTIFGKLQPERMATPKWTDEEIETTTGIVVKARGRGGQVRGLNHNGVRPEEVIVDDVDDLESVGTPEQLRKTLRWAVGDLFPVLPRRWSGNPPSITVLGTMLHRDMLMLKLAKGKRFTTLCFGAKLPDGAMLWADHMSAAALEEERLEAVAQGTLALFYMEFMSELRNDETAKFREDMFRYQVMRRTEFVGVALAEDPAISDKLGADKCAFGVSGMTEKGQIHVLDMYARVGMNPNEQIDKFFELRKIWRPTKSGIESVAFQAALIHLVREEMFRRKDYFEIIPIPGSKLRKTERVEGILQQRFAAGYISFQRKFAGLESELLDWHHAGDDEADVLAMTVALLDPYAGFALGDVDDMTEDDYEPLDEEMLGACP